MGFREIEDLYHRASAHQGDSRELFLSRACSGNQELRELLERMLVPPGREFLEPVRAIAREAVLGSVETRALEGRVLGEFQVGPRIGYGGLGVVHRAWQEGMNREVALEILDVDAGDGGRLVAFRRSASASSRLQHPSFVPVLTLGHDDGFLFLATELVDGWSLRALLDEGAEGAPDVSTPRIAARFALEVADGLRHALEREVLPDEVRFSNLLLDEHTGSIRISGLGPHTRQGTPSAPVRALAVFSVGAILHELLTGRHPFGGRPAREVLRRGDAIESLPRHASNEPLSRELKHVCYRALGRPVFDRYPDTDAMARDLRRVLGHL